MARFVIDLGDIDMDRESQEELANELRKVALSRVASMRIKNPFVVKFPIHFAGMILGPEFDRVIKTEKGIIETGFAEQGNEAFIRR